MKRVALVLAAGALFTVPAKAVPRDGQVQLAAKNTLGASLQRRGYELAGPMAVNTMTRFDEAVARVAATGSASPNPVVALADRTWQQIIKGLNSALPWPMPIGKDGQPFAGSGGNWGGGGATGSWTNDTGCGAIDLNFDAAGNLIVPSAPLEPGAPMQLNAPMWYGSCLWGLCSGSTKLQAYSMNSHFLRATHLTNMDRLEKDWFGVVGQAPIANTCIDTATIAYRDANGVLVPRASARYCNSPATYTTDGWRETHQFNHVPCPVDPTAGGDFHFYGFSSFAGAHLHECIHYYPNPQLSPSGYAINPMTTILWGTANWPNTLPQNMKDCLVDPEFVRRLTDALYKNATDQPAYDGAPYSPVQPSDSRPGDTKIDDLGDNPQTGATPAPNEGVNDPPPPTTPTAPPATGSTDVCDFGPIGCIDPQTGAPTVPDAPTADSILDPIFDWFPTLPSITLDTSGAPCPTWAMEPFGWQLTMDAHCPLAEDNRAIIGALMLVVWSIGAAIVILRA